MLTIVTIVGVILLIAVIATVISADDLGPRDDAWLFECPECGLHYETCICNGES